MGLITNYNKNNFISSDIIYSKIRREFKSFTGVNLIDDGEFPTYTYEVLSLLGIGTFKEAHALLDLTKGSCKLPDNFKEIHSAYRCKLTNSSQEIWRGQGKSIIRQDITCEVLGQTDNCSITCDTNEKLYQKVTTQLFIKDQCTTNDYNITHLLRLSPNVKIGCDTPIPTNDYEYNIIEDYIYTNFKDYVYIKYFEFPMNLEGDILIPDNIKIQKAVEWYIKYQILLNFWFSDDVQNIQNKWAKAEQEYNKWLNEARFELKTPSFAYLLNYARDKRANNITTFFQKQFR